MSHGERHACEPPIGQDDRGPLSRRFPRGATWTCEGWDGCGRVWVSRGLRAGWREDWEGRGSFRQLAWRPEGVIARRRRLGLPPFGRGRIDG